MGYKMYVPNSIKNSIDKLSKSSLNLEEELKLAERMENCRNLLLKKLYNKALFRLGIKNSLSNLSKGNRAGGKGQSWINNITVDSTMPQTIKEKVNKYLKHPTFDKVKSLNLDYSFIARIAENCNEKYNNPGIAKILKQYYNARNYLIGANIKQLLPYCYQYAGNTPFEDIFQTLYLAMIRASSKYNKNLGYKFGTLANWFLKNELHKLLRSDFPIVIPHNEYVSRIELNKHLRKERQNLAHEINLPIICLKDMFLRIDPGSGHIILNPGANFPDEVRKIIREEANYQCEHCGGKYKLQCHHIVPAGMGGSNNAENGILLCIYCHLKYGHLGHWKKYNEEISQTLAIDRYIKGNYAWDELCFEEDENNEDIIILNPLRY